MKRPQSMGSALALLCAILATGCQYDPNLYSTRRSGVTGGSNADGNGVTPTPTPTPTPSFQLVAPTQRLAAGAYHTCAVTSGGGAKCWGRNDEGQIGSGDKTDKSQPTAVSGLTSDVLAVTVGHYHSCALMKGGTVRCWGSNEFGQLGGTDSSATPRPVPGLAPGIVAVGAGAYHTCALDGAGDVYCWGANHDGQGGMGDVPFSASPVKVAGMSGDVGQISVGRFHTCAVTREGRAYCWGRNAQGQLGIADSALSSTPVVVPVTPRVVQVAAGFVHTCVMTEERSVACFGDNACGELGTGTNDVVTGPSFISETESVPVASIAVGGSHTCYTRADGSVMCAGCNGKGALGVGTTAPLSAPGKLDGLTGGGLMVTGGDAHTCAIQENDSKVWCWGGNDRGQVGGGAGKQVLKPVLLGL